VRADQIRREIMLDAPIEKVWLSLTDPSHLSRWFGDIAEVDLRPGGHARFGWSEFDSTSEAIIEVVKPPTRFSFRWESVLDTPVEKASTLVEFVLEPVGTGTRLTLVESGFVTVPETEYQQRYDDNSSGWTVELNDLVDYLSGANAVG